MPADSNDPPAPSRSLNRQHILEEDEYTEALSEIIARDFFPSLVHLDATNTYLDALQTKDPQLINASVRRLQDLTTPHASRHPPETPGRTPYGLDPSDTPMRTPRNEDGPNKRPRYDTSLSLDNFQARYTSEDNSSFTEILDEENRKRKEKYGWAWEAQRRAQEVKAIEQNRRSRLLIEDSTCQPPGVRERLLVEAPQVKLITAGPGEEAEKTVNEDSMELVKTGASSSSSTAVVTREDETGKEIDVMAPKKDKRPAGVAGWSFKTRNSLMFPPDADRSPFDGPTSLPSALPKGPPKIINHANTRLPEQSNEDGDTASTAPSSPTRSRIEAAISGTPYVPREDRSQFSLVPAVPSPTASQLGPTAVNKLMTWGTITSTPRILSSDPDAGPIAEPSTPFHLPGPTPRERTAHKLASSASRSLRAKASLLSGTPMANRRSSTAAPGTPRANQGLLTPAARRLLDRTAGLGTSASRRADAMRQEAGWEGGKSKDLGRVRWTPSPAARRNG